MDKEKVEKLAKLARIEITDKETEELSNDMGSILDYVGEIKKASSSSGEAKKNFHIKNILREDDSPHESGEYTEKILDQAPYREGDYLKVKKIL